jgi:hypothetical protein
MNALSKIRPQQMRCVNPKCRRVTVKAADLFKTTVPNRGGGTRLAAAWKCPICRTENQLPATHLPAGTIQLLPNRSERGVEKTPVPVPVWKAGAEGRRMLKEALHLALVDGASVAPMVLRDGRIAPIETRDRKGALLAEYRMENILDTLDALDCSLLVIGQGGKRPWTTIFDPRSGAASLSA